MAKELIEVIDENGISTGIILDKDEVHNKNLLHNEVGAFIINGKGEVLLQKRSKNKRYDPNKWALCAGHVDAGESLKTAMRREIKEELGIDVPSNDIKSFSAPKVERLQTNSHITYFYYVKLNLKESDFILQEEELSEVKWFKIDDVIEMVKHKNELTIFTKDYWIEYFKELKNV